MMPGVLTGQMVRVTVIPLSVQRMSRRMNGKAEIYKQFHTLVAKRNTCQHPVCRTLILATYCRVGAACEFGLTSRLYRDCLNPGSDQQSNFVIDRTGGNRGRNCLQATVQKYSILAMLQGGMVSIFVEYQYGY